MREKRWEQVALIYFAVDGNSLGKIEISSTYNFKVKQIIYIKSDSQPPKELEVKYIPNSTTLFVGPKGGSIDSRENISSYLVADNAFIAANLQNRSSVPEEQIPRNVYEEEPTVAIRTFPVDKFGNGYTIDNPMPVQLSDGSINVETLNAQLQVQLDHRDDFPTLGKLHDSIRIGDGIDELEVNADGSINVDVIVKGTTINVFNEVNALAQGIETDILTYTVPIGNQFALQLIEYDGSNIARYEVLLNGNVVARKHTYFSGDLHGTFDFRGAFKVSAGDIIKLRVSHNRPDVGQFSARLLGNLF